MPGESSLTSSVESTVQWDCPKTALNKRQELLNECPHGSLQHPAIPTPWCCLSDPHQGQEGLIPRSQAQIRATYFQKLQRHGMLPQTPRKKMHHLIVFDWDDTLFCTSYMSNHLQNVWARAGEAQKQKLSEIDKTAAAALTLALELGEVCVITNAVQRWVAYSCQTFMPLTYEILLNGKIEVLSAKELFQDDYPADPLKWKTETFVSRLQGVTNETLVNLISIGDSSFEMDAADLCTRRFERRFVKTIKLKQRPRPQTLLKQLKLIISKLAEVFSSPKSLTIKLQNKQ